MEKTVLIEARERPNIVKLTSLQLIGLDSSNFKSSSLDKLLEKFSVLQSMDSLKKPCSIPK